MSVMYEIVHLVTVMFAVQLYALHLSHVVSWLA